MAGPSDEFDAPGRRANSWYRSVEFKGIMWIVSLVVILFGAFHALRYYVNYQSNAIQSELDHIVEHGLPTSDWSKNELICFNSNTGTEKDDFASASLKAGRNIDASIKSCGVKKSCCDIGSDSPGAIGLVRNNEIECVDLRFVYVLADSREACIPPSKLKVSREVFTSVTYPSGRPWAGKPGSTYYKIQEAKP